MSRYARGIFFAMEDNVTNNAEIPNNNPSFAETNYTDELFALESLKLEHAIAVSENYAKSLQSLERLHDTLLQYKDKGIVLDTTSAQMMQISAEAICSQLNLPCKEIVVSMEHYENENTKALATNVALEGIGDVLKKALSVSFGLIFKIIAAVIVFVLAAIAFFKGRSGGSSGGDSIKSLPNDATPVLSSINSKQLVEAVTQRVGQSIGSKYSLDVSPSGVFNNPAPGKNETRAMTQQDIEEAINKSLALINNNVSKNTIRDHNTYIVNNGKAEAVRKLFCSLAPYQEDGNKNRTISTDILELMAIAPSEFMRFDLDRTFHFLQSRGFKEIDKPYFDDFFNKISLDSSVLNDLVQCNDMVDKLDTLIKDQKEKWSKRKKLVTNALLEILNKLEKFENENRTVPKAARHFTRTDTDGIKYETKPVLNYTNEELSNLEIEVELWPIATLKRIDNEIENLKPAGIAYLNKLERMASDFKDMAERAQRGTATFLGLCDTKIATLKRYLSQTTGDKKVIEDLIDKMSDISRDVVHGDMNFYYATVGREMTKLISYATTLITETSRTMDPYLQIARDVYKYRDRIDERQKENWKKDASKLKVWTSEGWAPFGDKEPQLLHKSEADEIMGDPDNHRYNSLTPFSHKKISEIKRIDSYGPVFLLFTIPEVGVVGRYANYNHPSGPAVLCVIDR